MASLISEHKFESFTCEEINTLYKNSKKCIELDLDLVDSDKDYKILAARTKMRLIIDRKLKITRDGEGNISESVWLDNYVKDQTGEINYNKYNNIIVTSDIHADLISFFLILIKQKLIVLHNESGELLDLETLANNIIASPSSNRSDIIYDALTKNKISFGYKDTLFVVLGDIVDGRRGPRDSEITVKNVENTHGINELIIHIILYNMRVSALEMTSNVIIILGNHDLSLRDIDLYNKYVDTKTKIAFGFQYRTLLLAPFYMFDPCIFKIIVRDGKNIGYLSHASFSGELNFMNLSIYDFSERYNNLKLLILNNLLKTSGKIPQRDIRHKYKYNESTSIREGKHNDLNEKEKFDDPFFFDSITWGKFFVMKLNNILNKYNIVSGGIIKNTYNKHNNENYGEDTFCDNLEASLGKNAFAIMGHCITGMYFDAAYKALDGHDGCDQKNDCIMSACVKNGIPKLFFVDNAISYANNFVSMGELPFNIPQDNNYEGRRGIEYVFSNTGELLNPEILLLVKNDSSENYNFFIARTILKVPEQLNQYHLIISNVDKTTGEYESHMFGSRMLVDKNPLETSDFSVGKKRRAEYHVYPSSACAGAGCDGYTGGVRLDKISGGNMYYSKYLKYKQKYLFLKNK